MNELEDLKKQKAEIEKRIAELSIPYLECGLVTFKPYKYYGANTTACQIAIKKQSFVTDLHADLYERTDRKKYYDRSYAVIETRNKKDAIERLGEVINDLLDLYVKLGGKRPLSGENGTLIEELEELKRSASSYDFNKNTLLDNINPKSFEFVIDKAIKEIQTQDISVGEYLAFECGAESARPKGEWIDTGDMEEYWAENYQCSICGVKNHWHNFCPHCGADMRKTKS